MKSTKPHFPQCGFSLLEEKLPVKKIVSSSLCLNEQQCAGFGRKETNNWRDSFRNLHLSPW
ncbi:hypothetical protein A2V54_03420 [candidate division WWE3 bacterium RBG_19FT_COMBO_53_11]|uniref:Uncharacterized protein n=1 Tax=candidate division WWE3 bacterium RBG_19FT_COMBO_53_11 TaxID=1802613 RepID=A0A1F4UHK1_UNCKA|nr:MAG: hypothetical protein A2V54_03420 [candidate division WWE3 bacterium RBG_19FT_COMBO_53_11]